jgi:hypothetical protein
MYIPTFLAGAISAEKLEDYNEAGVLPEELKDLGSIGEDINSIRRIEGYGARMSAPGYLDCTEWVVFDTEAKAEAYLEENYDVDEEDESESFTSSCLRQCVLPQDGHKECQFEDGSLHSNLI